MREADCRATEFAAEAGDTTAAAPLGRAAIRATARARTIRVDGTKPLTTQNRIKHALEVDATSYGRGV
jgi:hypothetical protein